jgi:hypothetical protein
LRPEKGGVKPIKIPDEIVTVAKAAVRRFGSFQPTLFVHGTKGMVFTTLPFGETYEERIAIMTQAGIQIAKSDRVGDLERVYFVSEAWVSPVRDQYTQPSQDPNRQEVLLFNSLDAQTQAQGLEMYACVRNWKQEIVDLKRIPNPDGGSVGGRLLPSFLAGFRLFKR